MECTDSACRCVCHICDLINTVSNEDNHIYSDNIYENDKQSNTMVEPIVQYDGVLDDNEALWERRRRIHRGEEVPVSFEDYKTHLPKLETVMKQFSMEEIKEPTKIIKSPQIETKKINPSPENSIEPKPTRINSLHKYKVQERDQILRDIFARAIQLAKEKYPDDVDNKLEFQKLINIEADKLLEIWMKTNKN